MFLADLLDLCPVSRFEVISVDKLYIAIRAPTEYEPAAHILRRFEKRQLDPVASVIVFIVCIMICVRSGLSTECRVIT